MSFELKPQRHVTSTTDIRHVPWTVPRNRVPPLLVGRVSLQTWMATFDACAKPYEYLLDEFGCEAKNVWKYIPCFVCCTFPVMIKVRQQYEEMWLNIAKHQNEIYNKVGVQVSVVTELSSLGSSRSYEMVGLRFDIAQQPQVAGVAVPGQQYSTMISSELQQLAQLHQAGVLTDHEFANAKSRLLNAGQPTATAPRAYTYQI